MKFMGIDYHKRYSVVCILDDAGDVVVIERIEHIHPGRFATLIGAHTPCWVAFEATMNWGWLYEILETIPGIERIVMANPMHVRLIAAAQVKTDKVDARKLAQLLRANLLPASHLPNRATRVRKEVLRQRTFWVRERTKVRNRIHRLLGRQHNLAMPQVSDLFGRKGRAALNVLQLPPPDDVLLRQQLDVLDELRKQIAGRYRITGTFTIPGTSQTIKDVTVINVVKVKEVKVRYWKAPKNPLIAVDSIKKATRGGMDHFVAVKGSGELGLCARIEPAIAASHVTWDVSSETPHSESGEATGINTLVLQSARSAAQKLPVMITLGGTQLYQGSKPWQGCIWVVWADGNLVFNTESVHAEPHVYGGSTRFHADGNPNEDVGNSKATWTIKPMEIITDDDHPDLEATFPPANSGLPPNPFWLVGKHLDTSHGATTCWDPSRDIQATCYDENGTYKVFGGDFPKSTDMEGGRIVFVRFPSDLLAVGNDDATVLNEDGNPYRALAGDSNMSHEIGEVAKSDHPIVQFETLIGNTYVGESGKCANLHYELREFMRIKLGAAWYRASDYIYWDAYYSGSFLIGPEGGYWWDGLHASYMRKRPTP